MLVWNHDDIFIYGRGHRQAAGQSQAIIKLILAITLNGQATKDSDFVKFGDRLEYDSLGEEPIRFVDIFACTDYRIINQDNISCS
ncbi:MAG: hypothetical protein ABS920_05715 [Sporosarcina sp.]